MGIPDHMNLPIEHGLPLLESAADRNLSVELHVFNRTGEFFAAKARVLAIDDKLIYLEQPQCVDPTARLSPGRDVEVYVLAQDKIFTFQSKIVETGHTVKLNDQTDIEGISIAKPVAVREGQRRHDYRVSLAAIDPITVHVAEAADDTTTALPQEHNRLTARLTNLSRSGCGVLIQSKPHEWLKVGRSVALVFQLPGEPQDSAFQAELCQLHRVLDGQATRLGLRFLDWPSKAALTQSLRPVERFIAQRQRQVAKRRSNVA